MLAAEQAESLARAIASPPRPAPEQESDHAYVRWSEGVTYICPWQTRLRSWLGLSRLRVTAPQLRAALPAAAVDAAISGFAGCRGRHGRLRIHIQARTWSVPPAWFTPFGPDERWLVLGQAGPSRALVYTALMPTARDRVRAAMRSYRAAGGAAGAAPGPGTLADLAQVSSWLAEFDPQALVELDYGGLVQLLSDDALHADQSVAEMTAVVGALARGELELATAMYRRVTQRWRPLAALERAS